MTWPINVDNGGTATGSCLVDGGEVRYTKTLATPYNLSRCLFDGLAKVSELIYGRPRLAALLQFTDCIRYSTTQGTNALVQRAGPQLGLLVTDPAPVEGLAATTARTQQDLLTARVNDLSARGARRLVIAVSGSDSADGEARAKGCTPVICSAQSRCCSPGNCSPTPCDIRAPGRACSTRSCTRPVSASCSTPTGGCGDARARQPSRISSRGRPRVCPVAASLPRSRDEAGPILGATGPARPFRTPGMRSSL